MLQARARYSGAEAHDSGLSPSNAASPATRRGSWGSVALTEAAAIGAAGGSASARKADASPTFCVTGTTVSGDRSGERQRSVPAARSSSSRSGAAPMQPLPPPLLSAASLPSRRVTQPVSMPTVARTRSEPPATPSGAGCEPEALGAASAGRAAPTHSHPAAFDRAAEAHPPRVAARLQSSPSPVRWRSSDSESEGRDSPGGPPSGCEVGSPLQRRRSSARSMLNTPERPPRSVDEYAPASASSAVGGPAGGASPYFPPPLGTPPGRRGGVRFRRMSAPVHDAAPPGVWRDDSDGDGLDGGAGSDAAEEAARRAATLRALRAAAHSRRAARISEQQQYHQPHHGGRVDPHARGAPLPTPAELAQRIARLDVNLQRYVATLLTQLEDSQAVVAPVLHAAEALGAAPMLVPRHSAYAPPPPMAPPAAPPSYDFLSDEGGPCPGGAAAMAAQQAAGGYASPGERETSASDVGEPLGALPTRPPPRVGRRPARFSAAGVAGEAPLLQQAGPPPPHYAPYRPGSPLQMPADDAEDAERELQQSPRLLGASASRLAARRVSHGHPGALLPALGHAPPAVGVPLR